MYSILISDKIHKKAQDYLQSGKLMGRRLQEMQAATKVIKLIDRVNENALVEQQVAS